jgi:hypothetical protein
MAGTVCPLARSVAEPAAQKRPPCLFIAQERALVDGSGALHLRNVLIPIDHRPAVRRGARRSDCAARSLRLGCTFHSATGDAGRRGQRRRRIMRARRAMWSTRSRPPLPNARPI